MAKFIKKMKGIVEIKKPRKPFLILTKEIFELNCNLSMTRCTKSLNNRRYNFLEDPHLLWDVCLDILLNDPLEDNLT